FTAHLDAVLLRPSIDLRISVTPQIMVTLSRCCYQTYRSPVILKSDDELSAIEYEGGVYRTLTQEESTKLSTVGKQKRCMMNTSMLEAVLSAGFNGVVKN
ncbi:hypothetical protein AB4238_02730, partial [Shewanella sp. 10N.286.45.A1]